MDGLAGQVAVVTGASSGIGAATARRLAAEYGGLEIHGLVGDFERHLKIPSVMMGFGLPDDGLHSPNEKYKIDNYYTGIMTIAHFFEQYGA